MEDRYPASRETDLRNLQKSVFFSELLCYVNYNNKYVKGNLKMKKAVSYFLLIIILGTVGGGAFADSIQCRAVIAADITSEQVTQMYQAFGVQQGTIPELSLTNAEEREYLEGYVGQSVIGTKSISCVYVQLMPQGSGMNVSTSNITWCTSELYINALETAGITDAIIKVAAPFPVSGTAALAGIYKAYEDMAGQSLDALAKDVGTQELTVTGELAKEIGSEDSASIVSELKSMLSETAQMSDEQLKAEIVSLAQRYRVRLTETQVNQLLTLCRSLEKLNGTALSGTENAKSAFEKVADAKEDVEGFIASLKSFIDSLQGIIEKLQNLLDRF